MGDVEAAPDVRAPARREDTKRLVTAFARIAERWKLSIDEQLALLGNPARSTYFKWKKEGGVLPRDTLDRLSYVFGIHEALQILFPDDEAAAGWAHKPNTNPMFGGRPAIEAMTRDLVTLSKVRQLLDTERGGWS